MRLTQYFLPTIKENPTEAQIVSHRLMLRAGMIRQSAAGIYSWLPLGLRVLRKVETIVREEQARAGAIEMLMPTLQPAELWQESGRYDDYGKEMLRITDRHDRPLLYGPTNEEMITDIVRNTVKSYKTLPLNLYHIQWKFRDEVRPRFGVMRGREFLMKDGYSFDLDEDAARLAYARTFVSYLRTYARMGLRPIPMRADTGPIGGNLSHEFIILADTGESEVFCHRRFVERSAEVEVDYRDPDAVTAIMQDWISDYAATGEMHDAKSCPVPPDQLVTARGIEVGHIFYFGTKYSASMKASVTDASGQPRDMHMGSYGIGVSRLVGAIIEASHDDAGIVWPKSVAPFTVAVVNLKSGDIACDAASEGLYQTLTNAGVEVLLDDRADRIGVKLADMDLIGVPLQILVGPKGLERGIVEIRQRGLEDRTELPPDDAVKFAVEWARS